MIDRLFLGVRGSLIIETGQRCTTTNNVVNLHPSCYRKLHSYQQ